MQRFDFKWLLAGSQIGKTALLLGLAYGMPLFSLSNYFVFFIIGLITLLDVCTITATQLIQTVIWFLGCSLLFWLAAN